MSSKDKPGVIDIAVIFVVVALAFLSIIVYFVSRCVRRRRQQQNDANPEESYDDVRTLERIHRSVFVVPCDNRGFNSGYT